MAFDEAHPLLHEAFEAWNADENYLGLDANHYHLECPPLLFAGGNGVPEGASPLVLLSIEPLRSGHYQEQVEYAGANFAQYVDWNLNLYTRLPELAPHLGPQAYFRNLGDFVAGWADVDPVPHPLWGLFSTSVIELPYAPMHATRHYYGAIANARDVLGALVRARLRLILAKWPEAKIVALGTFADRLVEAGILTAQPEAANHIAPDADEAEFGIHYFDVAWETRNLTDGVERTVLIRRGPFSNWQNPKAAGRRALGAWARQYLEGHP